MGWMGRIICDTNNCYRINYYEYHELWYSYPTPPIAILLIINIDEKQKFFNEKRKNILKPI
jgi:hypothetical protein